MEESKVKLDNHEIRITALEVENAINKTNIQNLTNKLDKIDSNISRLNWLILSAVVLAVMNLIMGGGGTP